MPPTSLFIFNIAAARRVASVAATTGAAAYSLPDHGSTNTIETASYDTHTHQQQQQHREFISDRRHHHDDDEVGVGAQSSTLNVSNTSIAALRKSLTQPAMPELFRRTTVSCESATSQSSRNENDPKQLDEEQRFLESLAFHRSQVNVYKEAWDYVENRTSRIPTISWPSHGPEGSLPYDESVDISMLRPELKYCENNNRKKKHGGASSSSSYCAAISFQIAYSILVKGMRFNNNDTDEQADNDDDTVHYAWRLLKELAEAGHADSMCLYAQLLNNGVNNNNNNNNDNACFTSEANPQAAVAWLHRLLASHPDHAQALYELGVAYYTGEGVVEDERLAVEYFVRAVQPPYQHNGAAYMLGDCLLDGVGVPRDRASALQWLITAGEWGHRGARSRVLAVLEHRDNVDYGGFTDASRQTFTDKAEEQQDKAESPGNDVVGVQEESPATTTTVKKEDEEDLHIDDDFVDDDDKDEWQGARSNKVLLNERKYTLGGVQGVNVLRRRKTSVDNSRNESGNTGHL